MQISLLDVRLYDDWLTVRLYHKRVAHGYVPTNGEDHQGKFIFVWRRFGSSHTVPAMICITPSITIDEREIEERFIRATGPGGQHVNKVATAVQLRFDVRRSPSLPERVRMRLEKIAGRRLTIEGVLVITARSHRSLQRNRDDARARLAALICQAAELPTPRRPTKPTGASRRRRLDAKNRRSVLKRLRGSKASDTCEA